MMGTDGDRLEVRVKKSSTLHCPIQEPPAACGHLKIRSLKPNKIKMKPATLGAFQALGGDGRPVAPRLDRHGAGEAVGLLSSALDTLRGRGEAGASAMPNRQVGTRVWRSERGVGRQHGAGRPRGPESG